MSISELNLAHDRTLVIGILNVTSDSFADGGRYLGAADAIARGLQMIAEGVDIIDIGGESTRPDAERISAEEELARVIPIISQLSQKGAVISIDTTRAQTAKASIDSGAKIVNDISAGLYDAEMLHTVAGLNCPFIAMHTRGNSKTMTSLAKYNDVVSEVVDELSMRIEAALYAGISKSNIILDPGIGFAKGAEHNWELLNHIYTFEALGYPVLIGASRKRFLGELTGSSSPDSREAASIALTALLAKRGVWGVRVHSVKEHRDAISVAGKVL